MNRDNRWNMETLEWMNEWRERKNDNERHSKNQVDQVEEHNDGFIEVNDGNVP